MSIDPSLYHFFWRTANWGSQWHPSRFVDDEKREFKNCEQYMMFWKGKTFGDQETMNNIMLASDPRAIKSMGKGVTGFNEAKWSTVKFDIVVQGNRYKFSQNPKLLKKLLATGAKTLVEASNSDPIWGIGLDEETALKTPVDKWPGLNLLGRALMQVRHEFKNK